MAVTSIWPISSRITAVIKYACNPAKTVERVREETAQLHRISNVVQYTANDMKTERREYVTGINCNETHAADNFMATKNHWKKTGGRLCFHGYQSFAKGETTAATAHAIGVELAKRLWGDRFEVLVATHCNTGAYRGEIEKRKATGIYALYLRYCYELRIIQRYPASAKRVSFFMREDLTKLDKLDAQALLLGRTGVKTIAELTAYKDSTAAQVEALTAERASLRNEIRRLQRQNAYGAVNEAKGRITGISQEISRLRKEIGLS